MTGRVLQINTSPGGLPKRPVELARVTREGIVGDKCANRKYHGGPLQALLLVASESVDHLIAAGYPLFHGALGENITMQGIDRKWMRAGQRYRIGEVLIELTKLRQPCRALDVYGQQLKHDLADKDTKAGDHHSPKWALGGFYASILQPGIIRPGDPITLVEELA